MTSDDDHSGLIDNANRRRHTTLRFAIVGFVVVVLGLFVLIWAVREIAIKYVLGGIVVTFLVGPILQSISGWWSNDSDDD